MLKVLDNVKVFLQKAVTIAIPNTTSQQNISVSKKSKKNTKRKLTLMQKSTKNFDIIMSLFRKYIPEFLCLAFFMIFILWMLGYIMNGLYDKSFDLESSLSAIGAIGSASVMTLIRYITDSKMNSNVGENPSQGLHDKINKYIQGKDFIDEDHNGVDDRCEHKTNRDMNYKDGE